MITKTRTGERVTTPFGAGVIKHHTDGYAGELDYFVIELDEVGQYGETVAHVSPANVKPEAAPKPRRIVFEDEECTRCGGKGRRSDAGWNANHHGICYRCSGTGRTLTTRGYRASKAFTKLRDETLGTTWGELTDGEAFWYAARCYTKGNHASLILREDTGVRLHNGPATRQMWIEIAGRYKGATLVY